MIHWYTNPTTIQVDMARTIYNFLDLSNGILNVIFLASGPTKSKSNSNATINPMIISKAVTHDMVLCMSVFGLITAALSNGLNENSLFSAYLMIVLKNFILAYPLQLLIMGPLVRGIFVKFVKPKVSAAV